MQSFVIPNIQNEYKKDRALDELPQSASGKTIMTTEPKFIPNESVEICLDNNVRFKTRLVDCVGYLVDGAVGHMEDDMPRMVKTPWSEESIPFSRAAEIGTKKVITEYYYKKYQKNTAEKTEQQQIQNRKADYAAFGTVFAALFVFVQPGEHLHHLFSEQCFGHCSPSNSKKTFSSDASPLTSSIVPDLISLPPLIMAKS